MEINANTSVLSRCTILKKKVKHIVTIPFSIIHYVLPMISVKLYYRMEIL